MTNYRNMLILAVATLPEQLQLPFALRFEQGFNHPMIAATLHMKLEDVDRDIDKALQILTPELEPFAQ